MEAKAVENFREYIRANTVHPDPDYGDAIKFLIKMAEEIDLEYKIIELFTENPICIMTWAGEDPSLPSLLLNSHTDVVPVYPEKWHYDPFEAIMTDNGNIYGRGTQDMKCVGIQYLEAIRILKSQNFKPLRTIHLSFVPDEEVGGVKGMVPFIKTQEFKKLNVGFSLDEGMASPTDTYVVYYGERSRFVVEATATGDPGHGSQFIKDTAAEKMTKFINKFAQFRESEELRWKNNPKFTLGDVTTSNLTMIEGGVQSNVIPSEMKAVFDCRVTTSFNAEEFKAMVENWATETGIGKDGIFIRFFDEHTANTATDDTNPWWTAFKLACDSLNMKIRLEIFAAATDSRYLRAVGIPALGFSPMIHTPILLHDHDEFLNRDIFLKGIQIYVKIIKELSKIPKY